MPKKNTAISEDLEDATDILARLELELEDSAGTMTWKLIIKMKKTLPMTRICEITTMRECLRKRYQNWREPLFSFS